MMTEDSIVYQVGAYWVSSSNNQYTVYKDGNTYATSDSSYPRTPDGFSLAKARVDYLAKIKIVVKRETWLRGHNYTQAPFFCMWHQVYLNLVGIEFFSPERTLAEKCAGVNEVEGIRSALARAHPSVPDAVFRIFEVNDDPTTSDREKEAFFVEYFGAAGVEVIFE